MPAASSNLTPCSQCGYSIELVIAPDTQATCPECGELNTGAAFIRRAQRKAAQRKAAIVGFVFVASHVTMIVMLAKFGNSLALFRAVHVLVAILAALLVTVISAAVAIYFIYKTTNPIRADAVIPAYFGIYLPGLVIAIAYVGVLFMLHVLRR
jgi:predicted RNA-binding Zn-ribbon protein involved in translation (DUF1610 family)